MRVPKYRKHSSRDFGFVEFQGKRHRFPGRYNSAESRRAYHAFLSRYCYQEFVPAAPVRDINITIREVVVYYLEYARGRFPDREFGQRRGSYWNIRCAIKRPDERSRDQNRITIDSMQGHYLARDYGPLALKELMNTLADDGASRNWINNVRDIVLRMFKWAASEELIPGDVWRNLQSVSGFRKGQAPDNPPRHPVAWGDVEQTLKHLSDPVYSMVLVHWHTGARSDSVCQAKPSQFDRSDSIWVWQPRHKMEWKDKPLAIPVGPQCQAIIKPFLHNRDADAFLFNPREWTNGNNRLYRDHYDSQSYRQAVVRGQERANEEDGVDIPHWTPHQIRHAKATEVRRVHGIEAAQIMLGHASIDVTQIYAERDLEKAKKIARDLG